MQPGARWNKVEVVAEGVESEETWGQLRRLGCDVAQGYYLTRPVPAAELERWLQSREPERSVA